MKRIILTCIMVLLTSDGLFAADDSYRMEAKVAYIYDKFDDKMESNTFGGLFDFYFTPVTLGAHPLEEAAFLEKSSSIGIVGSKTNYNFPSSSYYRSRKSYTIGVESHYLIPSTPIMLGIEVLHSEFDTETLYSETNTSKANYFSANIGAYIVYGLFAGTGYSRTTFKSDYLTISDNAFDCKIKYVKEFHENNALNIEAEYEYSKDTSADSEKVHAFTLISDFYFFRQLGAGVSYKSSNSNINYNDTRSYGIHAIGFPLNPLKIELEYTHTNMLSSSGTDYDTFSVAVSYRF